MSNIIDYSKYNITSTSQFESGLAKLRDEGCKAEIDKIFQLIDQLIQGVDTNKTMYARPLKDRAKMMHIHLDGRVTGNIILLYKVDGHDIELDLRLYNITDHKNLDRLSSNKFAKQQALHDFDVVPNKFDEHYLNVAEECYLDLISDYKFHQLKGEARKAYTNEYLRLYYDALNCQDDLSFDAFLQIIYYFENEHHKSIFGSLDFSEPQHTISISEREERYILNMIQDYNLQIHDAYIETEVDEYGDSYETMYIVILSNDFRATKMFENELYSLNKLFGISFECSSNGLGNYGKTYELYHYFQ